MKAIKMKGEISGNDNVPIESDGCAHTGVFTVFRVCAEVPVTCPRPLECQDRGQAWWL